MSSSTQTDDKKEKCFNDPVHGHIVLHELLVAVTDTPQFQRLRQLKQLGGCYYVYPGATHNRFEHSIGTSHLAGRLVRHLGQQKDLDEELKPTPEDILCVELAGLCHDLGHGPFSHVFDTRFLEKYDPEWKHEKGSQDMLEHLIKDNKMSGIFEKHRLDVEKDLPFIKQLIKPKKDFVDEREERKEKTYLFEIISNEINSVDVDKWDYFARDCHHVGIKNSFDHNRFMAFMKVLKDLDGKYHLCVKDKEAKNLYEMFHTRDALHRRVYKHKVTKAVEEMICDAMQAANDHITFKGEGGEEFKISETIRDMKAYQQLNDSVCDLILHFNPSLHPDMEKDKIFHRRIKKLDLYSFVKSMESNVRGKVDKIVERLKQIAADEESIDEDDYFIAACNLILHSDPSLHRDMEKAKTILERIKKRDLYSFVGFRSVNSKERNVKEKVDEIVERFENIAADESIDENDYFIAKLKFDYGMKKDNPVSKFLFYTKEKPNESKHMTKEEVSSMLPEIFLEYEVVVYCKRKTEKEKLVKCCQKWKQRKRSKSI